MTDTLVTGPSGHGKTELARRMGDLLTLEMECVDCTEMKHETDLFGPKKPYLGYQAGSPVNNFLARNSGKRCIVFLDEFEKTTREVQNALLIPFDEGEFPFPCLCAGRSDGVVLMTNCPGRYLDRRNQGSVDSSQTIWIIATNAVDDIILDYCESHGDIFDSEDQIQQTNLVNELSDKMKRQLKTDLGVCYLLSIRAESGIETNDAAESSLWQNLIHHSISSLLPGRGGGCCPQVYPRAPAQGQGNSPAVGKATRWRHPVGGPSRRCGMLPTSSEWVRLGSGSQVAARHSYFENRGRARTGLSRRGREDTGWAATCAVCGGSRT